MENDFRITKSNDEKQLVFGWGNVAIRKDGTEIEDFQHDVVDPEELEQAAYNFVLNFRDAGEKHDPAMRKKGKLVESIVFTKEKMQAMGIPEGVVPEGWWVGFKIEDKDAWEKIKSGDYQMFSIEGSAERVPVDGVKKSVEDTQVLSKSFADILKAEIEKYNPYHDSLGRFTSPNGGNVSFFSLPKDQKQREKWKEKEGARVAAQDKKKKKEAQNTVAGAKTKKGEFEILTYKERGNGKRSTAREKTTGYIDENHGITYHRAGQTWVASDQRTGLKFADGYSLKEAKQRAQDIYSTVENYRNTPTYQSALERFNSSPVAKSEGMAKSFAETGSKMNVQEEIEKFNPYHDSRGRFTTAGAAASFTYSPGKSKAHDLAIAREKDRTAAEDKEKKPARRELKLNEEYIKRANDASMFDAGKSIAREAQSRIDAFDEKFKEDPNWTNEQKAYVAQRRDEYVGLVEQSYNDMLYRRGNDPSWMVTGRANYNWNSHEKKMRAADNAAQEQNERMKRFEENTEKGLKQRVPVETEIARWRAGKWKHGETISADDPYAKEKLTAKLDYLNESQTNMKAANSYYRKHGTMRGFTGYSEKTNESIDAAMNDAKQRGYRQDKPFESFTLSNNNAQIKATQQRLEQLSKPKSTGSAGGGFSFSGGKVVHNTDKNRLQIVFDGKPDADMRNKLKARGFRWSPSEGAWQRQLTANAERDAKTILGDSITKSASIAKSFAECLPNYLFKLSNSDNSILKYSETDSRMNVQEEIEKFNPYHDSKGRFTTAGTATSFTYKPGASRAHDLAIAREKDRTAAEDAAKKPSFTPAKTKKEAVEYAKTQLGFGKVSYGTKLDIDTINHINEQITYIQAKYPEVKGAVQEIKTTSKAGVYAAITTKATGQMTFSIGTKKYGDGLEELERKYDYMVKTGYSPEGTTAKDVIWHEYGHVLGSITSKQNVGVSASGIIVSRDDINKFYNERVVGTPERRWIAEAEKALGLNPGEAAKNISSYAKTNSKETFAEAFSEVNGSKNPREPAVAIVKASGFYR